MAGIDDLLSGKLFDAVLYPFIQAGIPADMFYLFLLAIGLAFIYIKTKDVGMVSLTLIIGVTAIMPVVLPTIHKYLYALMFFGAISLIYSVYKGKK